MGHVIIQMHSFIYLSSDPDCSNTREEIWKTSAVNLVP